MSDDNTYIIMDENDVELIIVKIALNLNKEIYLIHIYKNDEKNRKSVINELIFVKNQILTSTYLDTCQFFAELSLYDTRPGQNEYFTFSDKQNVKNLKLSKVKENIYVTKAEAKAMNDIYKLTYNRNGVIDSSATEFRFSHQSLTKLLRKINFL